MIKITAVTVGELGVNCYVAADEATGSAAVIDPGEYTPQLDRVLSSVGFDKIEYILLTHGHFDHIMGVPQLLKKTQGKAKVVIGAGEETLLRDARSNLSMMFCGIPFTEVKADVLLQDGDELTLGGSVFKAVKTPGHTSGSVCYVCGSELFSGDTLFRRSAGRTDFPTGSYAQLRASLSRLAALPGDFRVYPGHDRSTTLEEERNANPYLA